MIECYKSVEAGYHKGRTDFDVILNIVPLDKWGMYKRMSDLDMYNLAYVCSVRLNTSVALEERFSPGVYHLTAVFLDRGK